MSIAARMFFFKCTGAVPEFHCAICHNRGRFHERRRGGVADFSACLVAAAGAFQRRRPDGRGAVLGAT